MNYRLTFMNERVELLFTKSAGVVLAVTGVAKAFSAIGSARALDTPDPIFGLPFRQVFLVVGLVEILIGSLLPAHGPQPL